MEKDTDVIPFEPTIRAGFARAGNRHNNFINESFNDFRVLLVISGRGKYISPDNETYKLYPGILVFREPNKKHSVIRYQKPEWKEFYIVMPSDLYVSLHQAALFPAEVPAVCSLDNEVMHLINKIAVYKRQYKNSGRLLAMISDFFYYLSTSEQHRISDYQTKIKVSQKLLEENLAEKLNIHKIAERIGMGYELFRKEFKKVSGYTPSVYRIRQKMFRARELLMFSRMNISQIADQLGYPDQFTFSRQFKRYTGKNPSQFKKPD
jgi:AraC-like DNA-binding protein